ncbi:MAG: tRNA (guanosine(46)-N7)-methyltransferase TrmB [Aureliella sp.]
MNAPFESAADARAIDLLAKDAPKVSWSDLVSDPAKDRPAELEIGCGKGLFLQNAALGQPGTDFVGIELSAKFANRAAQRLAKHSANNAVMLRGDAQRFVADVVPDQSVVAIHVYFPDPWWRNKHKKRRVLNEEVLGHFVRALKPGGQFHFWTDVLDYYEHICGQVMDLTPMEGPQYVPSRGAAHSMDYTTHFERRARLNSQPVYRAIFSLPK